MAITPSWLAVQEPGTPNKYADTNSMTRNLQLVQREVVSLGSPNASTPESFADVISSIPGVGDFGLVVRNIPTGTQTVSVLQLFALDATLTDGTQKSRLVDATGDTAGVTPAGHLQIAIQASSTVVATAGVETENAVATNLRVAVLPARANAIAPSWNEGAHVPLSTDLAGGLRVTGPVTLPVTLSTIPGEGAQQLLVVDVAARRLLEEILIELRTLNANMLPVERGVTNLRLVKEIS